MTSTKKLRKPNRDTWHPLVIVAPMSEIARWKIAAQRSGMTLLEWARDQLTRIAPEPPE
jgi:hypothetical protein